MNKKKIFRWMKVAAIIYGVIGIALYYLQEKILFHPVAVPANSAYHFPQPFTEVNIPVDAATNINVVQFSVPDSSRKGLVLYFHGNKKNITHYEQFAKNFTKNGYEVWMPDYPGYGKSTGKMSEQMLYDEALQVYKLARTSYRPGQIIIYGKSLGTGIAAQLASVRDCRRLILETPYTSIRALANRFLWMYPTGKFLLHFHMPTIEYLPKVAAPITVFHGTDDAVTPYHNAILLKKVMKPSDGFITIDGGTHLNLNEYPLMQSALDSLLQH